MLADLAAQARIVHVIGTTGFDADGEARIKAAARHAVIVKSGNMSLGVNLLAALVERAAKALPDYDIEILEMHHRMKVDAPSGTALLLGAGGGQGPRRVAGRRIRCAARDGDTGAREDGGIGFAIAARRHGGGRASGDPGRHRASASPCPIRRKTVPSSRAAR